MIDTISLKLHDLSRTHRRFYEHIIRIGNNRIKIGYKSHKTLLDRQIFVNEETSETIETMRFAPLRNPSSNYHIWIRADLLRDFIHIEFSIPKYFYGTNLMQTILHPDNKQFMFIRGQTDTMSHVKKYLYKELIKHIKNFFNTEFSSVPYDMRMITIDRIDLCYNQIFDSKQHALQYLEYQKQLKKKYLRDSSAVANMYKTSIFYRNDKYAFKIYHKGSEFQKNDAPKLKNAVRNGEKIDVNGLQIIADNILRYEITAHNSYLSYLYNTKVFRAKNKEFKLWKKVFNKLKSLDATDSLFVDNEKMLTYTMYFYNTNFEDQSLLISVAKAIGRDPYKMYSKKEIAKILITFYRRFSKLMAVNRDFYLDVDERMYSDMSQERNTNKRRLETQKEVYFNSEILEVLADKLIELTKDFRIGNKDDFSSFEAAIDKHNQRIEAKKLLDKEFKTGVISHKLQKNRILTIFLALKGTTIEKLAKKVGMSNSTKYELINVFNKLGFNANQLDDIGIKCDLTYSSYYELYNSNKYKLDFLRKKFGF